MGRLVLTRKEAQGLRFTIKPEHVAELCDLIRDGITITITELHKNQIKVAIEAPDCVLIMRDEVVLPT
ncbi:MAG: carbon storage regulator [Pseudomonas sp.]|nr:carbon storage regulator [Pseudomonas sp.]